jgi:GT2 family glycosyltransferase
MSEPRVHIILLNWNGWQDSIECIESLLQQDYYNYQVVLCDNDSQNGSVDQIKAWAEDRLPQPISEVEAMRRYTRPSRKKPIAYLELSRDQAEAKQQYTGDVPLVIINTGANLGFAGGNNIGFRFALNQGTDYCWLLNNDTVVEPNALRAMVDHSQQLSQQGILNTCGSVQCFYDDPNIIQCLGGFSFNPFTAVSSETFGRYMKRSDIDDIDHDEYREKLDAIHGCSWLLPRSFLEEIGLMEERYFLYFEEIDWATRSRERYKLTYAKNAFVYHKEGQSIGSKSIKKSGSQLSEFYCNYNKFIYAKKFTPWAMPSIFAYTLLQAANHLRKGQPDKAWMQVKIAFGKRSFS